MEFRILETIYKGKVFKIEEDYPEVGAYLYILEGDKCVNDYLQNDIETCMELALEDFGVPLCSWKEKGSNNEEE